jgi:hypothetical protein
MPHTLDSDYPADICLLLRAYGEHRWLVSELIPVLRDVTTPDAIAEDELPAALAYLEVLSIDASRRAAATEASLAELLASDPFRQRPLSDQACRYHAWVSALRKLVAGEAARASGRLAVSRQELSPSPSPHRPSPPVLRTPLGGRRIRSAAGG